MISWVRWRRNYGQRTIISLKRLAAAVSAKRVGLSRTSETKWF